jgi:glycosyltransferase involved in cell wall biosynthesis
MQISIAMATYNGGWYLQEQLDSFVSQSRCPDELIITDDRSTDDTLEIIKRFAQNAPFNVAWSQNKENLGYAGNFNAALMKTTGDLVFLSDQDDVWFPEKLERMERYALEDPGALVLMNDAGLTDGELNDTGLTKLGQIASAGMTDSCFLMGCCVAVRRELLDLCLPMPARYKEHDGWIVNMAEGVGRKRVVPDVLQWYRRHGQNESHFIANRTTKLTRGFMFKHYLSRLIQGGALPEGSVDSSAQLQTFLAGVRDARDRSAPPLSDEFNAYLLQLDSRLSALECRLAVRAKARWMRLPGVFRLWRKGAYGEFSGAKSAVRDLLFR